MMAISIVTKYETFYTAHSASAQWLGIKRWEIFRLPGPGSDDGLGWGGQGLVTGQGRVMSAITPQPGQARGRGTETHLTSAHPDTETNENKQLFFVLGTFVLLCDFVVT